VNKKISSGSFGVVFLGYDRVSKEQVAIKVEKEENEDVKSLDREVAILNRLKGTNGVPKIYWAGEE
jgi:predicted Ser/Thr protein kinase